MTRIFLAEAPSPESTYARLTSWAHAHEYRLEGDGTEGVIEWDPSYHSMISLDRLISPVIACNYSIRGAELTMSTEQDLPSTFANGLRDAGFLDVRTRLIGP